MTHVATAFLDEEVRVPATVDLSRFLRWARSDEFPERGRIDFFDGSVEVDLSSEDLYTHGIVKVAIAAELHQLMTRTGLGNVFVDSTRVTEPESGLSVEPDVVVVSWDRIQNGLVREVPAAGKGAGRYIELEGAPDLVVEIVSDSSVGKDRTRLPKTYAKAGIPELWIVDARGEDLVFDIHVLRDARYRRSSPRKDGWIPSPVLDKLLRLERGLNELGRWQYQLNVA